jgi:hypothetical protein
MYELSVDKIKQTSCCFNTFQAYQFALIFFSGLNQQEVVNSRDMTRH